MTDVQQMIMRQEGTGPLKDGVFYPYKDTAQLLTIGYGHCLDRKGLSVDMAIMLLNMDIGDAIEDVRCHFSCYDTLSRPRQLVLISMAFNLGRAGLGRWPRFISAVHLGHWDEAADEILDSNAAREDAPARYKQLARMMRENVSEWI